MAFVMACVDVAAARTMVLPTIDGEVRLHFQPRRISEGRLRELLLVSPYDLSTFIPPNLEQCIDADPAYGDCGTRTLDDPSFLYNAEVNAARGRDMLDAIDRLAPPLELIKVVDYVRAQIEFYVCLHAAQLAYYRGDDTALSVTCDWIDARLGCTETVEQAAMTCAPDARQDLAGYDWYNCMNHIFWQTRDPYPLDDWRDFLDGVGVEEEIIGSPHC